MIFHLRFWTLIGMLLMQPVTAESSKNDASNTWLQFGQIGGIVFIAWTVVSQKKKEKSEGGSNGNGGNAGAQPKEYWILQLKQANEPVIEKLDEVHETLRDIRDLIARQAGDPRTKSAGIHH